MPTGRKFEGRAPLAEALVVLPLRDGGELRLPLTHAEAVLEELGEVDAENLANIVAELREKGL